MINRDSVADELQIIYDQLVKLNNVIETADDWEIGGLIATMQHQLHRIGLNLPNPVRQRACASITHANGRLCSEFLTHVLRSGQASEC